MNCIFVASIFDTLINIFGLLFDIEKNQSNYNKNKFIALVR